MILFNMAKDAKLTPEEVTELANEQVEKNADWQH